MNSKQNHYYRMDTGNNGQLVKIVKKKMVMLKCCI